MFHTRTRRITSRTVVPCTGSAMLEVTAVHIGDNQATVQLEGELDFCNAALVAAVLDNHLRLGRHDLTLDLTRLSFLDCAGLGTLVGAHHDFLASGGQLTLTNARPSVAKLLDITGLREALFVVDADPAPRARHLRSVLTPVEG